jgi:hypothetical protein
MARFNRAIASVTDSMRIYASREKRKETSDTLEVED